MCSLSILFFSLIIDRIVGDPKAVWSQIPHPVVVMGKSIEFLDQRWNLHQYSDAHRQFLGTVSLALWLVIWVGGIWAMLLMTPDGIKWAVTLIGGAILISHNSLVKHVSAVSEGLREEGLAGGRAKVSMIVGRDPATLDTAGVSRAAIESAAENFSDGVIAPLFWLFIGGLPGVIMYKVVNTADSMVGHRTPRHASYGWASAKLDDLLNLPAARLTAGLITLSAYILPSCHGLQALKIWINDANQHASPNAGHPEAAMAGALGLALAGPRTYKNGTVDDPYINAKGTPLADTDHIDRALVILDRAWWICVLVTAAGSLIQL